MAVASGTPARDPTGGGAAPSPRPVPGPVAPGSPGPPPPPAPPGALTLVGSGHVFQVRDTIRQAILALRPDVVFVELDRGRLHALAQRQQAAASAAASGGAGGAGAGPPPGPPAPSGFVQKRLQKFQEGVAGMYGADVGEEMLAAVQAGQEIGAKVALIDPPADDTVRRVLKELTWRERLRAGGLLFAGGVTSLFKRG
ncbi:MAG: hypothetical protein QOJ26_417, partial [Thermoplasmata archaeon]|nr:hypothetical protein [Thermoplasmata archaeon]